MTARSVLSRGAAALAAAALAVVAFAVPSSAAPDVAFTCDDGSGADGTAMLNVGFGGGTSRDDYSGPIDVSFDGGDSWTSIYTYFAVLPPFDSIVHEVPLGGDTTATHPYMLRWRTTPATLTCSAMYYPIAIDAQARMTVTKGDSVSVIASAGETDYPNVSRLTMVAYLEDRGTWKAVGSGRVTQWGGGALATFVPAHSADLQVRVFDDAKDPSHKFPIGVHNLGYLTVDQPTPYLELPGTVYLGKTATLRAWYGVGDKGYAAILERWNGDSWVYVDDTVVSNWSGNLLEWKPTATAKYRLQFYGDDAKGNSKLVRTQYFTFSPSYKVTVTAPTTVKKNWYATFTVSHKLAIPFNAYLQRWSGGKWTTVKTFVPNDTATKVTAKITATGKWRISAAGYLSKTITVTAK